ncbi:PKD domain-containing protein [Candidatus Micrarchaeota archaeon]|nr:PKD domain-containing protein [Candidatus Micrarchaeota archaeon]
MKFTCIFLFFAVLLASQSWAITHIGDGTYKLYIGDIVKSSNNFEIQLTNISWHYNKTQGTEFDFASYDVKRSSTLLSELELYQNEEDTVSVESGEKNVTVTAVSFGYETAVSMAAYIPTKYYVYTKVESETYEPPPPVIDVEFSGISITPSKFSALVAWSTNVSSTAKIFLFNRSSSVPVKTMSLTGNSAARTYNLTGLRSDTGYSIIIQACTDNSCVNSTPREFTTLPVTPVISDVHVKSVTNDSAIIGWETDVPADARVYYRKHGETDWNVVPPALNWVAISKFFIFNLSDSVAENPGIDSLSGAMPSEGASLSPPIFQIPSVISQQEYSIAGDYVSEISDLEILKIVIRNTHAIKLYDLDDNVTYQYKVSSCADRCVNSSIYTFRTDLTILDPYANIVFAPATIDHGTSAVLTLSAYGRNPGGKLTNVKVEWDDWGPESLEPVFGGDPKSFISDSWPTLSVISITFRNSGLHNVRLTVTDNYSRTSTDTVSINVLPKTKCTSTSAIYYPQDTSCTNKWPNSGGASISYNNGIGACHAFEVCDDNLDYMIADAENCCNGDRTFSPEPLKNRGYGYDKNNACNWAIINTMNKDPMSALSSQSSMKMCKASYLVYGIGSQAIYMKDYYTAEGCCKASSFCEGYPHYQSWNPWPQSNIKFNELWCYWTDWGLFGKTPKNGWYHSDTNPESNNNALADIPAHASVNTMNTGTCVDYSFVVTTALRKAGFGKNEIMSIRTPGHLYNIVWLPGDSKYSFIDTVGNNGGDFFTGPGWEWKSGGKLVNHCSYESNRCSNDGGMKSCPAKSQVYGC